MVTVGGVFSIFVGSGKVVSAGSSMLGDFVYCTTLTREPFLGHLTDQSDVEQGSLGRDLLDDETDGASAKKGASRVSCQETARPPGRWQDQRLRLV